MKRKNNHLFLLGFAAASLILLTGFENSSPSAAKPSASTQKKTSTKQKSALRSKTNNGAALQKSLDLSIPFKDSENGWVKPEQNKAVKTEANMFAAEKKKKPRSLALDGQMLMSQEPEMDKKKSLDGAGIVINLKR